MSSVNLVLRVLLALWVFGYLFLSCAPLLGGGIGEGLLGLFAGAVLLVPWLIGIVVLAILVWLTNPRPH